METGSGGGRPARARRTSSHRSRRSKWRATRAWAFGAALTCVAAGCALLPAARRPPAGSESALRRTTEPYRVATTVVTFDDRARHRRLTSTVWWPADTSGPAPLVVQAHGFLANRSGSTYVARHLASRGYVVIAATHPNVSLFTSGGARVDDVVRQPDDIRFLIDRLLAGTPALRGLPAIDPARIAVMGHSLGGLAATLTAFHPRLRDPRIAAAISIAGPLAMFQPGFFETADVPFLMIAGTADVIVDYRRNALAMLALVPGATLVSIAGASHAGFDQATAALPRFVQNPDVLACWVLDRVLHLDGALAALHDFARKEDGVDLRAGVRQPCIERPPRVTMDPARQQMLTTLVVTAFLESRFAANPGIRRGAREYLTTTLPRELGEIGVATAPARAVRERGCRTTPAHAG